MKPDFPASMNSRYGWLIARWISEDACPALITRMMNYGLWGPTFIILIRDDTNRLKYMDGAATLLPE
jgi:hypothetical protein